MPGGWEGRRASDTRRLEWAAGEQWHSTRKVNVSASSHSLVRVHPLPLSSLQRCLRGGIANRRRRRIPTARRVAEALSAEESQWSAPLFLASQTPVSSRSDCPRSLSVHSSVRTCSDRCDDGMGGGGLSDTETAANQTDKDEPLFTADVVAEKGSYQAQSCSCELF